MSWQDFVKQQAPASPPPPMSPPPPPLAQHPGQQAMADVANNVQNAWRGSVDYVRTTATKKDLSRCEWKDQELLRLPPEERQYYTFVVYLSDKNTKHYCYDLRKLEGVRVGMPMDKSGRTWDADTVQRLRRQQSMLGLVSQTMQVSKEVKQEAVGAVGGLLLGASAADDELARGMFGRTWAWIKDTVSWTAKKVWRLFQDNFFLVNASLALYSLLRMCVCLYLLPGTGILNVLAYLARKFTPFREFYQSVAQCQALIDNCGAPGSIIWPSCWISIIRCGLSFFGFTSGWIKRAFNAASGYNLGIDIGDVGSLFSMRDRVQGWVFSDNIQQASQYIDLLFQVNMLSRVQQMFIAAKLFPNLTSKLIRILGWVAGFFELGVSSLVPGVNVLKMSVGIRPSQPVSVTVANALASLVQKGEDIVSFIWQKFGAAQLLFRLVLFACSEITSLARCLAHQLLDIGGDPLACNCFPEAIVEAWQEGGEERVKQELGEYMADPDAFIKSFGTGADPTGPGQCWEDPFNPGTVICSGPAPAQTA